VGGGGWGVGVGGWGVGPHPPTPNPQSPISNLNIIKYYLFKNLILNNIVL